MTVWIAYRKCGQVCGAPMARPCRARSGRIVDGRPADDGGVDLEEPHHARLLRSTPPGTSLARLIAKECARRAVAR